LDPVLAGLRIFSKIKSGYFAFWKHHSGFKSDGFYWVKPKRKRIIRRLLYFAQVEMSAQ
jgi:phage-related protein